MEQTNDSIDQEAKGARAHKNTTIGIYIDLGSERKTIGEWSPSAAMSKTKSNGRLPFWTHTDSLPDMRFRSEAQMVQWCIE